MDKARMEKTGRFGRDDVTGKSEWKKTIWGRRMGRLCV